MEKNKVIQTTERKCPRCKKKLFPGHKNERNIIEESNSKMTNVLFCEECWYDEPYEKDSEIDID